MPAGSLYVGDQISLEVIPPTDFLTRAAGREARLTVRLGAAPGRKLAESPFAPFGLGGRLQATLLWFWDTSALPAGEHTLFFSIEPEGPRWSETVTLLPRGQLPPAESRARWASARNDCCLVYYVTNTAAERDLPELLQMLDAQALVASQRMGVAIAEPVEVTLLPRLIGHGGFAGPGIVLSYLDRNYASSDAAIIFHHELIHILDGWLGGLLRPPFLVEGVAVFQSGGHFKPEPLLARAAALLPPEPGCLPVGQALETSGPQVSEKEACGLGLYIPLEELAGDFYRHQHEIGYLESGALVQYMVDTWGWKAFSIFYRDIQPPDDQPAEDLGPAIDSALMRHFGLDLTQLEGRFIQALRELELRPEHVLDVRLTLEHFDRVRRYQQAYQPSAYFLNSWLPDGEAMRQHGIVADVLRGPATPRHLALEALLASADRSLRLGRYADATHLLEAASAVLSAAPSEGRAAFGRAPLAADYLALVEQLVAQGYRPEWVQIDQNKARIWASHSGPKLVEFSFVRVGDIWAPLTALSSLIVPGKD